MARKTSKLTQPRTYETCVDCGRWSILSVFVTGARLCDPCGRLEELAAFLYGITEG